MYRTDHIMPSQTTVRKTTNTSRRTKKTAKPEPEAEVVAETSPVKEVESEPAEQHVDEHADDGSSKRRKRQRNPVQSFEVEFEAMTGQATAALTAVRSIVQMLSRVNASHKKEAKQSGRRTRSHTEKRERKPTTSFTSELVDYLNSCLDSSVAVRREESGSQVETPIDLSTDTLLHRTDATFLLNKAFLARQLKNEKDARYIDYQRDSDLTKLLVQAASAKLDHLRKSGADAEVVSKASEVLSGLKSKTYRLSMFNIQGLLNHFLRTGQTA